MLIIFKYYTLIIQMYILMHFILFSFIPQIIARDMVNNVILLEVIGLGTAVLLPLPKCLLKLLMMIMLLSFSTRVFPP